MGYKVQIMRLGVIMMELLCEGLGLNLNHLEDMEVAEGLAIIGHYYPSCPQPELTLGTCRHSDTDFFTILLQDQIGGLQFLHHDQWVNVHPIPGALLINIGYLMQVKLSVLYSTYTCFLIIFIDKGSYGRNL